MIIYCDYCGSQAELVKGDVIYHYRPDLYDLNFWWCKNCDAYVGCHKGTDKPLGRLANAELRKWKSKVHRMFDPKWKNGNLTRADAYKWLAKKMAIEINQCHIGMFDILRCKKAIKILEAENENI